MHLLSQALVTLDDYRPATHGVDVDGALTDVGAYVDWLKAIDRPHRILDRMRLPRLRSHPASAGAVTRS